MTLAEKQRQWIEDLGFIEDPQERLMVLVDQSNSIEPVPEEDREEARRVPGCVSAVWVEGVLRDGKSQFLCSADSSMVRGLVGLLCRLYSGHTPEEVRETEPEILEALQLAKSVSPTRMQGLQAVRQRIREIATAWCVSTS